MTDVPGPRYGKGQLVNANDAAFFVFTTWKTKILPLTIRKWASRRHIGTYGARRERYDLREIVAYATHRGLIPRPRVRNTTTPNNAQQQGA